MKIIASRWRPFFLFPKSVVGWVGCPASFEVGDKLLDKESWLELDQVVLSAAKRKLLTQLERAIAGAS